MVTTAVPKRPPVGVPSSSTRPVVRPSQKAVIVVPVIARIGRAVDSNSILTLPIMFVPCVRKMRDEEMVCTS